MKLLTALIGVCGVLSLGSRASAQPVWASGFASGTIGSTPACMLVWDDDGAGPHTPWLVMGGSFTTAGGATVNRIARWSGDNWYPFGTGMSSGSVLALCEFDDDGAGPNAPKLYAAGTFTNAGGVAVQNIARWTGSAWEALPGGGLNSQVNTMLVYNGKLYAGGFFTGGLARYDGTAWTSLPVNGTVNTLCLHDDGLGGGPALYLGGTFTSIAGVSGAARIAKYNGTAFSALSTGISGSVNGGSARVNALASFQGKLIAGGLFSTAGAATSLRSLAQWNGSTWSDFAGGVSLPSTTGVTVLYPDPAPLGRDNTGGGLWCGSDATNYGTTNTPCNRWGLYDGAGWSSPGGGVFNAPPAAAVRFDPSTGGPPTGDGGGLFIASPTNTVAGAYQPGLAVFYNNSYHTIGGGITGTSIVTQVRAVSPFGVDLNDGSDPASLAPPGSSFQVGGLFDRVGDTPAPNLVVVESIVAPGLNVSTRIRASPQLVPPLHPPAGAVLSLSPRTVDGVLFGGGQFTTLFGGTPAVNVFGYNPATGCFPLGAGLSGGFNTAIYSTFAATIAGLPRVLFSGDFLGAPGPFGAAWATNDAGFDTSLDLRPDDGPGFGAVADPSNPNFVYINGNFDNFGGAQGPYVVKLDTATGVCSSLGVTNPAGGFFVNGPVVKVVVPDSQRQLALGYLALVCGDMTLPQRGLAARTSTGTWVAPVPNDNLDGGTTCGAFFDDGTPGTWFYFGGFFTKSLVTNTVLNKIAKVNLALPPEQRTFVPVQLNGLIPGFNNNVRCMESAVMDTNGYFGPRSAGDARDAAPPPRVGVLLIGGDFTTAGGLSSSRIAAIVGTHMLPPACPADFNGDGVVNTLDLAIFLRAFGKAPGDRGYLPRLNLDPASPTINTFDLAKFLGQFGVACPS